MTNENIEQNIFLDIDTCFNAAVEDRNDGLSLNAFDDICRRLFCNSDGVAHKIPDGHIQQLFEIFDQNRNGFIDRTEFEFCWSKWIRLILRPVNALVVVDVQNDFITGSLALSKCAAKQDAKEVIRPINDLLKRAKFDLVVYSMDWHPADHISFYENVGLHPMHKSCKVLAAEARPFDKVVFDGTPPIEQILWPTHSIQNTWGSQLHDDLTVMTDSIKVYKGTDSKVDCYSSFGDKLNVSKTILDAKLQANGVTDIYVCGLAYDICVIETAMDALKLGYRTILLDDCCRGTDAQKIEEAKQNLTSNNGIIISSFEVDDMIKGNDRRPELAFKRALDLAKDLSLDLSALK